MFENISNKDEKGALLFFECPPSRTIFGTKTCLSMKLLYSNGTIEQFENKS